jgi:hypothetical protein
MRFPSLNGTESEIGGRELGPVNIVLEGEKALAREFISHGRAVLGELKQRMEQGNIQSGKTTKELSGRFQLDGKTMQANAKITAESNQHGLADIDKLTIRAEMKAIARDMITGFIARVSVKGKIPLLINVMEPGQTKRMDFVWPVGEGNPNKVAVDGFFLLQPDEVAAVTSPPDYPKGFYDASGAWVPDLYGYPIMANEDSSFDPPDGDYGYTLYQETIITDNPVVDPYIDKYPSNIIFSGTYTDQVDFTYAYTGIYTVLESNHTHGPSNKFYYGYSPSGVDWSQCLWNTPTDSTINDGTNGLAPATAAAQARDMDFTNNYSGSTAPVQMFQGLQNPVTRYICSDYEWDKGTIVVKNILDNETHEMTAVCINGEQKYAWNGDATVTSTTSSDYPDPVIGFLEVSAWCNPISAYVFIVVEGEAYTYMTLSGEYTQTTDDSTTLNFNKEWSIKTKLPSGQYKINVYNQPDEDEALVGADYDVDIVLFGSDHFTRFGYSDTIADDEEKAPITCLINVGMEVDYTQGMANPHITLSKN